MTLTLDYHHATPGRSSEGTSTIDSTGQDLHPSLCNLDLSPYDMCDRSEGSKRGIDALSSPIWELQIVLNVETLSLLTRK